MCIMCDETGRTDRNSTLIMLALNDGMPVIDIARLTMLLFRRYENDNAICCYPDGTEISIPVPSIFPVGCFDEGNVSDSRISEDSIHALYHWHDDFPQADELDDARRVVIKEIEEHRC